MCVTTGDIHPFSATTCPALRVGVGKIAPNLTFLPISNFFPDSLNSTNPICGDTAGQKCKQFNSIDYFNV